jgi:hypothetical protein
MRDAAPRWRSFVNCHEDIHAGTSCTANTMSTGEPDATEIGHVRFGGGSSEKDQVNWHLVGGLPYVTFGSVGARG